MANGPSERNRKFTFGFLNTAQDANDAEITSSVELDGVDLDKLALGTAQLENYSSAGSGAPDWQTTQIVGDEFQISGNNVQYEEGGTTFTNIDSYLTAPDTPSVVLHDNGAFIEVVEAEYIGFTASDVVEQDTAHATKATISGVGYVKPNESLSLKARLTDGKTNFQRWINTINAWDDKHACDGTFKSFANGVNVSVPAALAASLSDGDQFVFNVSEDLLEDGNYFYTLSIITEDGSKEIESLYSDVAKITLANENNLGALIATNKPKVTVPRDATDDQWLYRKGPQDEEWYRIVIIESGAGDAEVVDNILTSSLIDTKIIEDLNPVSMADLLASVDSTSWSHIFEKDNRLWAIPAQKKDVVFYSEPLAFWRWTKTNSIGFNGDFRGTASLRDTSNVNVQNTAVFVTSSGLYNLYGNGTEDTPYVRVTHEENFGTVADSLVKANNVLYMISDGEDYNDGEWGRKLYSYDLTSLTELSGIVQNSDPFVDDNKTVSYVNQVGGNKLKILMTDNSSMIYHITGNGFGESSSTSLTTWSLKTAVFHPQFSFQGKMMNTDKFRMEYNGTVNLEWFIEGDSQGTDVYTRATRGWDEFMLPGKFGGNCQLKVSGTTGVLYDFWFVSRK